MRPENLSKLSSVFRAVLEMPEAEPVDSVRRLSNRRWDSLAHVSIVIGIESEFKIRLSGKEQEQLASYKAAALLLSEKGF